MPNGTKQGQTGPIRAKWSKTFFILGMVTLLEKVTVLWIVTILGMVSILIMVAIKSDGDH